MKRMYYVEWRRGILDPVSSYTTDDAAKAAELVAKKQAEQLLVRLRYEDVPESYFHIDWVDSAGYTCSENVTGRDAATERARVLLLNDNALAVSVTFVRV